MKAMCFHPQVRTLRMQLFSMLRLSQRALDYSIKGFRLNHSDFTRHVHGDEAALELQHRRIRWLCCSLMDDKDIHTSDFRFAVVALRLSKALHTTYKMTSQIAWYTRLYLERNPTAQSASLDRLGERVNSLMRLCIVSLLKEETAPAEAVLRSEEIWSRWERIFDPLHLAHGGNIRSPEMFERGVARNLGVIAKQAHEMADAILYWLRGNDAAQGLEFGSRFFFAVIEPA